MKKIPRFRLVIRVKPVLPVTGTAREATRQFFCWCHSRLDDKLGATDEQLGLLDPELGRIRHPADTATGVVVPRALTVAWTHETTSIAAIAATAETATGILRIVILVR